MPSHASADERIAELEEEVEELRGLQRRAERIYWVHGKHNEKRTKSTCPKDWDDFAEALIAARAPAEPGGGGVMESRAELDTRVREQEDRIAELEAACEEHNDLLGRQVRRADIAEFEAKRIEGLRKLAYKRRDEVRAENEELKR